MANEPAHPLDAYPITPPMSFAKPPPGELAIMAVEGMTGVAMPEADKAALLEITDAEGAGAYLAANYGPDIEVDQLKARSVFSTWLFRKIKVEPMMLTSHMQTIMEAEAAIKFARDALERTRDVPLLPEQEAAFLRCLVFALEAKSKMVTKAQKSAHDLQPHAEPDKPKNRPPEILNQTNILVQGNGIVSGK